MLVNLENAQIIKSHGQTALVLDMDKQFNEADMQSLNVQQLFANQQNPSFLAIDEDYGDLINLSYDNSGTTMDKRSALWAACLQDQRSGKYPFTGGIFLESMQRTFDTPGDLMSKGRKKYIHSVGATAKVKFVKKGGDYTGIFEGADAGLIRLSSAA